jgi:hypothetical protein
LRATIDTAVSAQAVRPAEFERVIVETTVQEKAMAHPVGSRLLEIARHQVVKAAKRAGILLKQTFAREGKEIRRKRLRVSTESPTTLTRLDTLLERAERIRTQQPKDKNKLYALHAPEVECIGKGKARKPYEFGVKTRIAVTHGSGLAWWAQEPSPATPTTATSYRPNWNKPTSCWKEWAAHRSRSWWIWGSGASTTTTRTFKSSTAANGNP